MGNRVKKNIHLLKVLHDSKPGVRNSILKTANKEVVDTICECLHNVLLGNVKVPPKVFRKLKRNQKQLRVHHSKRAGLKQKKQILIQQGGFLPALLAPILGIAGSLIGGLIK
jgi:hypothetical protein